MSTCTPSYKHIHKHIIHHIISIFYSGVLYSGFMVQCDVSLHMCTHFIAYWFQSPQVFPKPLHNPGLLLGDKVNDLQRQRQS